MVARADAVCHVTKIDGCLHNHPRVSTPPSSILSPRCTALLCTAPHCSQHQIGSRSNRAPCTAECKKSYHNSLQDENKTPTYVHAHVHGSTWPCFQLPSRTIITTTPSSSPSHPSRCRSPAAWLNPFLSTTPHVPNISMRKVVIVQ
jgi:hypothetical protein